MEISDFNIPLVQRLIKEPVLVFSIKSGCEENDAAIGNLIAMHIKAKSGKTFNLVYKTTCLEDTPFTSWVTEAKVFNVEQVFYKFLVPKLESLVAERKLANFKIPVPKYFDGQIDGKNTYICLEDERCNGYVMPDKFKCLNILETSLVLKELAKFHALTYFLIKSHGENLFLEEGWQFLKPKYGEGDDDGSKSLSYRCYDDCLAAMELRNPKLAAHMVALLAQSPKLRWKTDQATDTKYFPVIVHGDLWINNILIKYDSKKQGPPLPVSIKFVDFQFTRRGNIFVDLQYFIFTSTTPDFRREFLLQALNVYYDSFCDSVQKLRCPKPIGFTRGFFVDNFYQCYPTAFVYMTFAVPIQLRDSSFACLKNNKEHSDTDDDLVTYCVKRNRTQLKRKEVMDRLESIALEMDRIKVFESNAEI